MFAALFLRECWVQVWVNVPHAAMVRALDREFIGRQVDAEQPRRCLARRRLPDGARAFCGDAAILDNPNDAREMEERQEAKPRRTGNGPNLIKATRFLHGRDDALVCFVEE